MNLVAIMACVAALYGVPPPELPSIEIATQEHLDRMPGNKGAWGKYVPGRVLVLEMNSRYLAHEFGHHVDFVYGLKAAHDKARLAEKRCG